MEHMEEGTALLAMRGHVPLVPMLIMPKLRAFHVTHCWIGEPIEFDDLLQEGINKETSARLNERITQTYVRLQAELVAETEKNK